MPYNVAAAPARSPASARSPAFARVLELADRAVAGTDPASMRWTWGQALLAWSLSELDAFLGEDRYLPFCSAYCAAWAARGPRVDQSDTCAPALAAWALYRRTGDPGCRRLAELGADYVRREPRLGCGLPNHLGHSLVGRLYPKSAWVDSLMMFGLLAARYGAEAGDAELLEYAASLPGRFASLMQDEGTGLFRHSYRDRPGSAYPRGPVFWARGNGWMAAALPAIRGFLPEGSPGRADAERSLSRLAEALLPLQRPDGWWDTLLGPGGGAYRESSATALVAAGWARSARDGLLDARCAAAARRAYASLVASLGPAGEEPSMREISAPTIPLPLLPRLGYALVPKASDLSYGLAALFLAAVEIERLGGAESAGGGT